MIETPERYQKFLAKVGGKNDFGEPNFILIWGENRTIDQLALPRPFIAPYFNCWVLAKWYPAEEFGSPSDWMPELGPYPSRGGYIPLAVFRTPKQEPVKLDSSDLNFQVLELWIFTALKHEHDRISQRMAAYDEHRRRIEEARVNRIADLLQDAVPAFGTAEAVSFHGQANCNPALKQKMEQIEKTMPYAMSFFKRLPKRTSIQLT